MFCMKNNYEWRQCPDSISKNVNIILYLNNYLVFIVI